MSVSEDELVKSALHTPDDQVPKLEKFFATILEDNPDHLPALMGRHVLTLRTNNLDSMITSLREVLIRTPYNPRWISECVWLLDAASLAVLINAYLEKYPSEAHGYIIELGQFYTARDPQKIRDVIAKCYAKTAKGIHYQPSVVVSIFDAAMGADWTSVAPPNLPSKIVKEIMQVPVPEPFIQINELQPGDETLKVITMEAEPVGLKSIIVNGLISGAILPTKYFFRYGSTRKILRNKTEIRQLPPGRYGKARETSSNIFRRINSMSVTTKFLGIEEDQNFGSASMKLEGPFGKDRNHLNGIGVIDLMLGWQSAVQMPGTVPRSFTSKTYPKPIYPGQAIDLRDAEFTVTYRTDGLDAKEFHPVAWIHGGSGEAFDPNVGENYSAWAYTADLGSWKFVTDGNWHKTSFSFKGNSKAWSFCGSNVEEMGEWMEKICYHPISEVLRENIHGNICLCFICGDQLVPPEGDIEIGALDLKYRSYSLLSPDQGTSLVSYPNKSSCDPSALTNGWIGSMENVWLSEENPSIAQEFIWGFREDASIQSVKLHNNPLWPSRDIQILTSIDGKNFEQAWSGSFEDIPLDPVKWPNEKEAGVSFNFAKTAVFAKPINLRFLKLIVNNGFRKSHWGMDAVEVFGSAPAFIPSPEPCTVLEEITDVKPGPLFIQLVAENELGRVEGEVIELDRPHLSTPLISDTEIISFDNGKANVRFRVNAMGSWGELSAELTDSNSNTLKSNCVSIGKQEAAREAILSFYGLKHGVTYNGSAIASNKHGMSEQYKFTVPMK